MTQNSRLRSGLFFFNVKITSSNVQEMQYTHNSTVHKKAVVNDEGNDEPSKYSIIISCFKFSLYVFYSKTSNNSTKEATQHKRLPSFYIVPVLT